jgi:hypothetical protein
MRFRASACAPLLALAISIFLNPMAATAQEADNRDSTERLARYNFQNAMGMWRDGLFGGLLFYHDGRGPLSERFADALEGSDTDIPRPVVWRLQSMNCASDVACSATVQIRFTGENADRTTRYRLVRRPEEFFGLYSEEVLSDPPAP